MNEATAAQPAPEPPRLDTLMLQTLAELGRARRVLEEDMRARGELIELTEGWHRLSALEAAIRNAALLSAAGSARAAAPEPEPPPRRPRPPARRGAARSLRAVRGLVPAAGLGTVLRHSWAAAHPVATGAIATGAAAAIVTTAAVVPGSPAHGAQGHAAGTPAPAASIWSAVPVTPASPSRSGPAVTGPKLDADAASLNPLTVPAPASYVLPDAPPPDSRLPQDPQQQAAGTLTADVAGVDLGAAYAGQVTITAAGGPVSWGAVRGSRDLAPDSARGMLQAGESATIGITVSAAARILGGSTTLTLWPGDIKITVTWPALPVPSSGPSPADVPSVPPSVPGS